MNDRKKNIFGLAFPVFFFLVISSFNFFHTEKTPFEDQKCPACNLQHSTKAIELLNAYQPPLPEFSGFSPSEIIPFVIIDFNHQINSRSPPPTHLPI